MYRYLVYLVVTAQALPFISHPTSPENRLLLLPDTSPALASSITATDAMVTRPLTVWRPAACVLLVVAWACVALIVNADDGSGAWLRYRLVSPPARLAAYRAAIANVQVRVPPTVLLPADSRDRAPLGIVAAAAANLSVAARHVAAGESLAQLQSVANELTAGLSALLGRSTPAIICGDAVAIASIAPCPAAASDTLVVSIVADHAGISQLGPEGFLLTLQDGHLSMQVATSSGALYGAFHVLQMMMRSEPLPVVPGAAAHVVSVPAMQLRIWDQWDNLNGNIERGFGGNSVIWPYALDTALWTPNVAQVCITHRAAIPYALQPC